MTLQELIDRLIDMKTERGGDYRVMSVEGNPILSVDMGTYTTRTKDPEAVIVLHSAERGSLRY